MPSITISKRWEVIRLKKNGTSEREIAKELEISKNAIHSIWKKFLATNDVINLPQPGRPKKYTPTGERRLKTIVKRETTLRSEDIAQSYNNGQPIERKLSAPTVRRILCNIGMRARVRPIKWRIKPQNKIERVKWAKKFQSWTTEDWNKVIFTDECLVKGGTARTFYRIQKEEYVSNIKLLEKDPKGVSIMVCAALSINGIIAIKFIEGVLDSNSYKSLIEEKLSEYFEEFQNGECFFQQDSASIHTSGIMKEFFNKQGFQPLEWPPQSPNVNLIENVWSVLKSNIAVNYDDVRTLKEDIFKTLQSLKENYVLNLYRFMPKRVNEIIKLNGDPTKY